MSEQKSTEGSLCHGALMADGSPQRCCRDTPMASSFRSPYGALVAAASTGVDPSSHFERSLGQLQAPTQSSRRGLPGRSGDDAPGAELSHSLTSLEWLTALGPHRWAADASPKLPAAHTCTQAGTPGNKARPISVTSLTAKAILASPMQCCTYEEVCDWIAQHCPELTRTTAWRTAVRNALKLNKCFQRLDVGSVADGNSKSTLWTISPFGRERFAHDGVLRCRKANGWRRPSLDGGRTPIPAKNREKSPSISPSVQTSPSTPFDGLLQPAACPLFTAPPAPTRAAGAQGTPGRSLLVNLKDMQSVLSALCLPGLCQEDVSISSGPAANAVPVSPDEYGSGSSLDSPVGYPGDHFMEDIALEDAYSQDLESFMAEACLAAPGQWVL